MARTCDCEHFKRGMDWISGCEGLAYVHGSRFPGDVTIMSYCAWCGKELKDEEETKVMPYVKPKEE